MTDSRKGQDLVATFSERQYSTLVLSCLEDGDEVLRRQAADWWNSVHRLGVNLPFFIVHDLGGLLSSKQSDRPWRLSSRRAMMVVDASAHPDLRRYEEMLRAVEASDTRRRIQAMAVSTEVMSVVLVRALGDCIHQWRDPAKGMQTSEIRAADEPLDMQSLVHAFQRFDPQSLYNFLAHVGQWSLRISTAIELINVDTIRLLGMYRGQGVLSDGAFAGQTDVVDLMAAMRSPEAADVVDFSLDLMPSLLQTKRSHASQTFSVDGYASLERVGGLDSLMLSELAYDDEVFEQKLMFGELLYYAHERHHSEDRTLHYVLVDSSASMRGERHIFARGMALALLKKISLKDEEIWLRFFDSTLYETCREGPGSTISVPYVLSFRSERGRHYDKVFRRLVSEITHLRRKHKRDVVVYVITHGQCHIHPELMAELAKFAKIFGIIILPSSEIRLDWLNSLAHLQVVSMETLTSREGRKERALDILSRAESMGR